MSKTIDQIEEDIYHKRLETELDEEKHSFKPFSILEMDEYDKQDLERERPKALGFHIIRPKLYRSN